MNANKLGDPHQNCGFRCNAIRKSTGVAYGPRTSAVVLRRSKRIRARTVQQISDEATICNTPSVHELQHRRSTVFRLQPPQKRKHTLHQVARCVPEGSTTKRQRQVGPQSYVRNRPTYTCAAQSFRFLDLPPELRILVYRQYIDFSQPRILSDGRTTNMPPLLSVSTRVRHEFAHELQSATALSCDVVDMNFAPVIKTIKQYFTPPCMELAYKQERLLEVHLHSQDEIEESSLSEWVRDARKMVGHRRYHKELCKPRKEMFEYLSSSIRKCKSLGGWEDKEEKEEMRSILAAYKPSKRAQGG
ncbi:hypothetical protein BDV97DRAFT_390880 [Delphinella strobiligena]|nr:hypothetical protein BDV97DRAFT_390880 [Delphinella strobiligena]